jgi:hypothetical protein
MTKKNNKCKNICFPFSFVTLNTVGKGNKKADSKKIACEMHKNWHQIASSCEEWENKGREDRNMKLEENEMH